MFSIHIRDRYFLKLYFVNTKHYSRFVKTFTGSEHRDFQRGGIYYATDPDVNRAATEADDAVKKSLDERLELIVCMEPSESEGEEVDSLIKGADLNGKFHLRKNIN